MPLHSQWLLAVTGHDARVWVSVVQRAIKRASRPSRDPKHDATNVCLWLDALVRTVRHFALPRGGKHDENMRMASVLGLILSCWYARVHWAKIHDPARPARLRRQAYRRRQEWLLAIADALTNGALDTAHFPGQRWDVPLWKGAKSGTFV